MNFSQYAFGITKNSILEYFSDPITKKYSINKQDFEEFITNLKLKDIEKEDIEPKKRPEEAKKEEPKKRPEETKKEEPKKRPEEAKKEEPKKRPEEAKKEEPKKRPEEVAKTFRLFCEDEPSNVIFEKILLQIKGGSKMDKIYTFPEASKDKIIRALTSKNCKYINLTEEEMKVPETKKFKKNKWGSSVGEMNIVFVNEMAIGTQTDDEEQIFCLTEKEINYCENNNIKYDTSNALCEIYNI